MIAEATCAVALAGALATGLPRDDAFDAGRVGFTARIGLETCAYRELAFFTLPGETLPITVLSGGPVSSFRLSSDAGVVPRSREGWRWRAPKMHGLHVLRLERDDGVGMTLRVFVLVPRARVDDAGYLNGYRIGAYPKKSLRGLAIYEAPAGFVEVTEEYAETHLSPHFTLGQFLCKQAGSYPKYVVLRTRLLMKLELLLERLNELGHRSDGLEVMSGYRTPFYNEAIGNVRYSRHLWGGAADVYLDVNPRDGVMDDLDGNGTIDLDDARELYRIADELFHAPRLARLVGGLGLYDTTNAHGPFVHVDVRGSRARWGD